VATNKGILKDAFVFLPQTSLQILETIGQIMGSGQEDVAGERARELADGTELGFYGGTMGLLAPFLLFLGGVGWLGIAGAPNERGFWPVLLASLALGLLLARDRSRFSEVVIHGMSRPLVVVMILAWLFAGALGRVLSGTGFVEALSWLAAASGLTGGGYVVAAFVICALVATATGTSLGTLLVCGPLLYPTGGALGVWPPVLMGAILAGSTFGDNLSPISDTTIASAITQEADIAGVVRSRLRYAIPAAMIAAVAFFFVGGSETAPTAIAAQSIEPQALVMLVIPVFVIVLLLRGHHLLEGLLFGTISAAGVGLALGLLRPKELFSIDAASYSAGGLLLEGMESGVGASIFTLLLMGLVAPLEASGFLERVVSLAQRGARSVRAAELWIVGTMTAAVLLTTHSTVAILTVGGFAKRSGERFGISRYRRANLLDVTGCGLPFILPYMIPTILAATTTSSGDGFGMPRLGPLDVGLVNFHSWALLIVLGVSLAIPRRRQSG
jgi:Na+/H+ antiporter NhaC